MAERTRAEHLAWAKARALEYVEAGDVAGAIASMASDLTKWEDGPLYRPDTFQLSVADGLLFASKSADATRRWIEGFS